MGDSAHALCETLQLSLAFLVLLIAVGQIFVIGILTEHKWTVLGNEDYRGEILARRMFLPQGGKVPQVPSGTTGGDA